MSKVLGIIAEYNPFHNGHLYHLDTSKKITGCDNTVAIISGNFTQRGSTSVIDKWSKTKMALQNGVDLVIELPVLYSISSSENFADGAIKILNSLEIIDYLSFGSETPDITVLDSIADILCNEPKDYKKLLTTELDKGLSFPKARENALLDYIKNTNTFENDKQDFEEYKKALSSPNNILGIEYLKALKKYNSSIKPVCISRFATDYNSTDLSKIDIATSDCNIENCNLKTFASATAIRELIKNKDFNSIKTVIPENSYSVLMDCINSGHIVPDLNCFEKELIYTLRKMSIEEISNLPDVSEGLEFSIKKAANSCNTINEFLDIVKSKRYTVTRLQRILLYALLNISKEDMQLSKQVEMPYVRVLGFNDNGKKLISEIATKHPELKIITSVKKFIDTNSDKDLQILFDKDVLATDVYSLAFENNSLANLDFKNGVIKY